MPAALQAGVETKGLVCSLSVDQASPCVTTRTGRSPHRPQQATAPTQIGRALAQRGIERIPAHSPPARGRMERLWEPRQGRLPQALRLAGLTTVEGANRCLVETWVPCQNRTWTVAAGGEGTALVPSTGDHLDRIGARQPERVVGTDHGVECGKRHRPIPKTTWRDRVATCRVTVSEHLDDTLSLGYGPHILGHDDAQGRGRPQPAARAGRAA